jgi:hypothetical protein
MSALDLRCLTAQPNSGIGNVTTNTGLVEMAMAYSGIVLCAAARLGVADALGDELSSVGFLAEKCQTDANALYPLLRALASMDVTEETSPEHFRLTPFGKPLRRDRADCVQTGKPAHSAQGPRGLPKFAGCRIHLAFR